MLKQLTNVTVWVHDQDEALAFYTEKLGMELRDDVTVAEMIASLKRVAGNRHLGEIRVEPDPFIERIVAGWPVASTSTRARALGLAADESLDPIVRGYIEDFLPA